MAKSESKPKTGFYVVIGILLVLVAVFAVLYAQTQGSYSSVKYNYSVLQSNYNTLKSNYTIEKVNFSSLQAAYNNLSKKYNITEYNLTHTYTKVIFTQKTINLPGLNISNYTYNSSLGIYTYNSTYGSFNFSFYAPYPGYIMFNGSSTITNNPSFCSWTVYVSNKSPQLRNMSPIYTGNNSGYTYKYAYRYKGNDALFINLTSTPFVELCPLQFATYFIPVNKGTNYVFIDNDNSTSQTITFSAKYIGFHTS